MQPLEFFSSVVSLHGAIKKMRQTVVCDFDAVDGETICPSLSSKLLTLNVSLFLTACMSCFYVLFVARGCFVDLVRSEGGPLAISRRSRPRENAAVPWWKGQVAGCSRAPRVLHSIFLSSCRSRCPDLRGPLPLPRLQKADH